MNTGVDDELIFSFVAGEPPVSLRRRARQQRLLVLARPGGGASAFARRCPARACRRRRMVEDKFADCGNQDGHEPGRARHRLEASMRIPRLRRRTASSSVPSSRATDTVGIGPLWRWTGMRTATFLFLSPSNGGRLHHVRVFLVTQTSRRGIRRWASPPPPTPPASGRPKLSPFYDPVGPIKPLDPIITGHRSSPPSETLPSSSRRCLP